MLGYFHYLVSLVGKPQLTDYVPLIYARAVMCIQLFPVHVLHVSLVFFPERVVCGGPKHVAMSEKRPTEYW